MKDKQYMLMILDGIGINEDEKGNALKQANTPNLDNLLSKYPNAQLETSGKAVGLPEGQMGNSEVGHMTIGAGRVIYQDLTLIYKNIENGDIYKNIALLDAVENAKKNNSSLHIFGLLSDGGVHSHIDHIYALLELAKREKLEKVYLHVFMDGRDTPTTSGVDYIRKLEEKTKDIGVGKIATIMGRYYAMDRNKNYDRTEKAYLAITNSEGKKFKSAERGVENSYEAQVFDEFVEPIIIVDDESVPIAKVTHNDSVIFANFRPDRARQLTYSFVDNNFKGFVRKGGKINSLKFVTMTEYDKELTSINVAFKKENIKDTLGEVLDKRGYTQFRIAETEKYAHVTFFLNGGQEKKFESETRVLIESKDVPTYDLAPEMCAQEITDKIIEEIDKVKDDVIIVNYANGDMLGHTGNLQAAIKSLEILDACLGNVITKLEEVGGEAIIIADHGNCEQMLDVVNGDAITSHSLFKVPIIVVSKRVKEVSNGDLSDVAVTLLNLMNINKPNVMTGKSLIEFK